MQFEEWPIGRALAADVLGVEDGTLANWLNRYNVFPEKRRGSGVSLSFLFRDVFKLAVMATLIEHGLSPSEAADAVRPYSPYGSLLHNHEGEFVLTRNNDGRWVGADGPDKVLRIVVRTWPVFDRIFAAYIKNMVSDTRGASKADIKLAVDEYRSAMSKLREERGL